MYAIEPTHPTNTTDAPRNLYHGILCWTRRFNTTPRVDWSMKMKVMRLETVTVQLYNNTTGTPSKNIDKIWSQWISIIFFNRRDDGGFCWEPFSQRGDSIRGGESQYCTILYYNCTILYWYEILRLRLWGLRSSSLRLWPRGNYLSQPRWSRLEWSSRWDRTLSHVMTCHVMSCHVMLCHVMSCIVMSFHVMKLVSAGGHRGGGVEDPAWHGDDGGPQTRGQPPHGVARGGLIQVSKYFN